MVNFEGKSPFLVAIESNKFLVVKYILSKTYSGTSVGENKLIREQMNACDRFGNNPLHKACRFRNPKMIEILFKHDIGDIS